MTQRIKCSKRSFSSRHEARRVAFRMGLSAYECPRCHAWHLTSDLRGRR